MIKGLKVVIYCQNTYIYIQNWIFDPHSGTPVETLIGVTPRVNELILRNYDYALRQIWFYGDFMVIWHD